MSNLDKRNEIVKENLPLLVKHLTHLQDDDENLNNLEQLARTIIRNHRTVSINSHIVRRSIHGFQEKFKVSNMGEYADYFGFLCEQLIEHPLCVNHYEIDVQWSLLDFLLSLSYNPTGAFRLNKEQIDNNRLIISEIEDKGDADKDYLINLLREDFVPIEKPSHSSDSELSDWSDCDDGQLLVPVTDDKNIALQKAIDFELPQDKNLINPPKKPCVFYNFDCEKSTQILRHSVQNTWWHTLGTYSNSMNVNFATAYNRFISKSTNNMIRLEDPIIISEECLIRELIWIFHAPQECKFFVLSNRAVKIRKNVSLPSVTVNGIGSFLEETFLKYVTNMVHLREFINSIYSCEEFTPPKTLECFAASLNVLLEQIWQKLQDYEIRVIEQREDEVISVIDMENNLRPALKMLELIDRVHQLVVCDLNSTPPHIASAFLLARLMSCYKSAINATESNLAIALFLTSMKVYCAIIDTWWTEGRLEDWQQEFMIDRTSETEQDIFLRPFNALNVPSKVSEVITSDACLNLIVQHCLKAGRILNLLYDINRMADLRDAFKDIESKLYSVFIEDVMHQVQKLQSVCIDDQTSRSTSPTQLSCTYNNDDSSKAVDTADSSVVDPIISNFSTTDEFLLLAFAEDYSETAEIDLCNTSDKINCNAIAELSALQLFEIFQQTPQIMPFEEIILSTLERIFDTRIGFVNSFVIQMYRNEFGILQHITYIRKILLLEASDLMHEFYSNLFKQIEAGKEWANPYLLSSQLYEMVCAKLSTKFNIKFYFKIKSSFRCRTIKVLKAVEELNIRCKFSREIAHVIKPHDIKMYNELFRFLLKVKWGLTTLENMRFPRSRKRLKPYSHYGMIDLLMRRLEQVRFWMLFAVQTINFHLMTHVLQAMSEQLDEKLINCNNLKEIETVHDSYLNTICEHCFLRGDDETETIKLGVEQLIHLITILRLEWDSCTKFLDSQNNPLDVESSDDSLGSHSSTDVIREYLEHSEVGAIEETYIKCHQYLANKLNNEVYLKQNTFFAGLSDAFNTSMPY